MSHFATAGVEHFLKTLIVTAKLMHVPWHILPVWIILMVSLHSACADAAASPGLGLGDEPSNSVGASGAAPPSRSANSPCHELPSVAQASVAVGQIAALERMLAPEKDARIIALRRKEQRKEAQYRMEMRLLRGTFAYQWRINKLKL